MIDISNTVHYCRTKILFGKSNVLFFRTIFYLGEIAQSSTYDFFCNFKAAKLCNMTRNGVECNMIPHWFQISLLTYFGFVDPDFSKG
jgi:hypothetical protein